MEGLEHHSGRASRWASIAAKVRRPLCALPVLAGLAAFVGAMSMGAQSCGQPGALGVVGTDVCLTCHNGQLAPDKTEFRKSRHKKIGCEACHGPGYLHVRNGGRGGDFIFNPASVWPAEVVAICERCHATEVDGYDQSEHAESGEVACRHCHDVHSGERVQDGGGNVLCLRCHEDAGFDSDAAIEAHTFHSIDPEGTGASRCVRCHMPPLTRLDQARGPHGHSMVPIPPIESNRAAEAGVKPIPPNSCSGIVGCHDGSVVTAPVFNVDSTYENSLLQILFDARYPDAGTE